MPPRPLLFLLGRLFVALLTVALAGVLWSSTDQVFRFDDDHTVGSATILSFVFGCGEFLGIGFLASAWRRGTCSRTRFIIIHAIPAVLWIILLVLAPYALTKASGEGAAKVLCRIGDSCLGSRVMTGIVVMVFLTWITAIAGLLYAWLLPKDFEFADKKSSEKEAYVPPSDGKAGGVRMSMQPVGTTSNLSINHIEGSSRSSLNPPRSQSPGPGSLSAVNSATSLPDISGPHAPMAPPKLGAPSKSFEDAKFVGQPRLSRGPRRASKLSSVAMTAIPSTPDIETAPPLGSAEPPKLDTTHSSMKIKRKSLLGSLGREKLEEESHSESSGSTPSPEPKDESVSNSPIEKRDSKRIPKRHSKRETKSEFKVNSVAKVHHEIEEGETKPLPIVPRGRWTLGDDLYETGPMITQRQNSDDSQTSDEKFIPDPVNRRTLTDEHLYSTGPMVSPLDSELMPRRTSPVLSRQQKIAETTSKLEGQGSQSKPSILRKPAPSNSPRSPKKSDNK